MKRHLALCLCASLASCSSSEQAPESAPIADASADFAMDATTDSAADSAPETSADSAADSAPETSADSAADSAPETSADSHTDSPPDSSFLTCENACAQTSLTLNFGSVTKNLNRAQFGFDNSDSGAQFLYIEAHFGGESACPSASSPTPDRTVIFANIPIPLDSTPIESIPVTLLDFKGDLSSNPLDKATKVKIIPVAINTTPASSAFIAFDVDVTFANGTMSGHLYARHCDSLDE